MNSIRNKGNLRLCTLVSKTSVNVSKSRCFIFKFFLRFIPPTKLKHITCIFSASGAIILSVQTANISLVIRHSSYRICRSYRPFLRLHFELRRRPRFFEFAIAVGACGLQILSPPVRQPSGVILSIVLFHSYNGLLNKKATTESLVHRSSLLVVERDMPRERGKAI